MSTAAVAVCWSGYFDKLLDNLFGFQIPDALSYAPIAHDPGDTTGIINLLAVVLCVASVDQRPSTRWNRSGVMIVPK